MIRINPEDYAAVVAYFQKLKTLWFHLHDQCNLSCAYCFRNQLNLRSRLKLLLTGRHVQRHSPETVASAIDAVDPTCHVCFTGAESFVDPDFVKLCILISQQHLLSINTNLSTCAVEEFARVVHPSRIIRIRASVHMPELKRNALLGKFVRNASILMARGFPVHFYYVLYPPLVKQYAADACMLRRHRIVVHPIPFQGVYQGKQYPSSYEDDACSILTRDCLELERRTLNPRNHRGMRCLAGTCSMVVYPDGTAYRCYNTTTSLGNMFEGTAKFQTSVEDCQSSMCQCVSHGELYCIE